MKRSTLLRRQSRITTSFAPPVRAGHVNVVRPEAQCCPCCEPPCAIANRHTEPCTLMTHQATS